MANEMIILGAGCFWCIEHIFSRIQGVDSVISGYADGHTDIPNYQNVCTGNTGYAEVVKVTFDNNLISFDEILTVFFSIHDPTSLNRQGDDIGTQYRSTILYFDEEQKKIANNKIAQLNASGIYQQPIVTSVKVAEDFYNAETYHQNYFNSNPGNQYCQLVVAKKVDKFFKQFPHLLTSS